MSEVPRFRLREGGEGSVVLHATRERLTDAMGEILMLCNEAVDAGHVKRQTKKAAAAAGAADKSADSDDGEKKEEEDGGVETEARAALPRVLRVGAKPLSLEYVADRLTTDDPIWGYMVRHRAKGWLQGFINLTTFTTWSRGFRFDSLHEQAGILDDAGLTVGNKPHGKVDHDGSIAAELQRELRGGYADGHGVVWPHLAEVSLLGGLGCGGWLLRLIIDELEAMDPRKSPYRWLVLQATDNSMGFYEHHGFVRVGAVAIHKENEETRAEAAAAAASAKVVEEDAEELKWLGKGHESCPTEWIESKADDTPRSIAARFRVECFDVIFLNKMYYPQLKPTSKLMKGTRLRVPIGTPSDRATVDSGGRIISSSSSSSSSSPSSSTTTTTTTTTTASSTSSSSAAGSPVVESVADALRRRRAFRHVCEENERPIDIARRFNVDAKELVRLNKRWYESLTQLALLREGTELRIPSSDSEGASMLDCDDGKCAYRHWTFPDDPVEFSDPSKMMVRRLTLRPLSMFKKESKGPRAGFAPADVLPPEGTPLALLPSLRTSVIPPVIATLQPLADAEAAGAAAEELERKAKENQSGGAADGAGGPYREPKRLRLRSSKANLIVAPLGVRTQHAVPVGRMDAPAFVRMRWPRGTPERMWPVIPAVMRAEFLPPRPVKPKRPLTAFMLFLKSLRDASAIAMPAVVGAEREGVTSLAKRAGAAWQAMAAAEVGQEAWRTKAAPAMQRHAIALASYNEALKLYEAARDALKVQVRNEVGFARRGGAGGAPPMLARSASVAGPKLFNKIVRVDELQPLPPVVDELGDGEEEEGADRGIGSAAIAALPRSRSATPQPIARTAARYYFVLTYIPDLEWVHLAPLFEDGVFGKNEKDAKLHGRPRWKLIPEGRGAELHISSRRCVLTKAKAVRRRQNADNEEWDIVDIEEDDEEESEEESEESEEEEEEEEDDEEEEEDDDDDEDDEEVVVVMERNCQRCRSGRGVCLHRGDKGHLEAIDDGGGDDYDVDEDDEDDEDDEEEVVVERNCRRCRSGRGVCLHRGDEGHLEAIDDSGSDDSDDDEDDEEEVVVERNCRRCRRGQGVCLHRGDEGHLEAIVASPRKRQRRR